TSSTPGTPGPAARSSSTRCTATTRPTPPCGPASDSRRHARRNPPSLGCSVVSDPRKPPDDLALVARLRAGDETAFMILVEGLGRSMLRVARMYVSSDTVAGEVVQDAWLGVLRGLDGFEGRSSLRTWIF